MPESTRQRQAFESYWAMGADRSIDRLADQLRSAGRAAGLRTLYAWSSRYRWQDRNARLEREALRLDDEARVQVIREMADRHAKEALLLQQRGAEWLTTIDEERVTVDGAIRAIVEGVRMERLARGEPTERTEARGDFRIDARLAIADDELDRLIEYAERAVAREGAADAE